MLAREIQEGAFLLASVAGENPVQDAKMSGKIKAFSDILNMEADEL